MCWPSTSAPNLSLHVSVVQNRCLERDFKDEHLGFERCSCDPWLIDLHTSTEPNSSPLHGGLGKALTGRFQSVTCEVGAGRYIDYIYIERLYIYTRECQGVSN